MNKNEYKDALKGVKPGENAVEKFKAIAENEAPDEKVKKLPAVKSKRFRRAVAIAASVALVVGIFSFAYTNREKLFNNAAIKTMEETTKAESKGETKAFDADDGSVNVSAVTSTFKSREDLKKYIEKTLKENSPALYVKNATTWAATAAEAVSDVDSFAPAMSASDGVDSTAKSAASTGNYAKTYVQELGIDEADIIKTYGDLVFVLYEGEEHNKDGEYYFVQNIGIFRVKEGNATRIALLRPFNENNENIWVQDMYVTGDRLVVNATKNTFFPVVSNLYDDVVDYVVTTSVQGFDKTSEELEASAETTTPPEGNETEIITEQPTTIMRPTASPTYPHEYYDEYEPGKTITLIYDIGKAENPRLLSTFEQSGTYISSRMIGEKLYVISNFNSVGTEKEKMFVPFYSENGNESFIDAGSIAFDKDEEGTNYIVATEINAISAKREGSPKAVIGGGYEVYCSSESLYVYNESWNEKTGRFMTKITKLSLNDELNFVASASIPGEVNSSYSLSENGGDLFVCSTLFSNSKETNVLRVLDKDLKEIAKTDYFATGESIKAVKYIDHYAYVITYEETDPLFVIDIADHSAPKLLGHAIVSGFSTMLVDVGDDQLLGIGYCTGDYDYADMEVTDGVKFTLFDVSDPLKPKVLDEKEFKNIYSEAQEDPKAFIQNPSKGQYVISYYDDYSGREVGAIVASVKDGKINIEKDFNETTDDFNVYSVRITFVDDWYYLVDGEANFRSFKVG